MKKILIGTATLLLILNGCGKPNAMMNQPYGYNPSMQAPLAQGGGYDPSLGYQNPSASTPYGYGTDPSMQYGQQPYGTPYGNGYGQPGAIDPVTGQPIYGQGGIDPVTGQPLYGQGGLMINPALDRGISAQIVSKIQSSGGYKGFKADDAVRDALKSLGTSLTEAFMHSPVDHRSLIVKTLLDGWASSADSTYAQQIWNTLPPMEQQRVLSQDSALNDLVRKKMTGGGSSSSPLAFLGNLFGKKKS